MLETSIWSAYLEGTKGDGLMAWVNFPFLNLVSISTTAFDIYRWFLGAHY